MKILITGGAGFIGSHVSEHFAQMGDEVVVFDNLSRSETLSTVHGELSYNWRYLKDRYPTIEMIKGDVRDFEEVKVASKGTDAIVHTAGQVAVTTSVMNPRIDFEINTLGTFNVLEAARLNDSMVVYTSTNKVYGEAVNKIPLEEEEKRYRFTSKRYKQGVPETLSVDLGSHSPYGCSKLAADIYVQEYGYTYGLKNAVFRMSCIYGERQFGVEDQGWIAWFAMATLTRRPITIYGDGKQVRDVLYVSDLVNAFARFIDSDLSNEVFNIGGGPQNTMSLLELLELLRNITGKTPTISYASWRKADQKVYISDISKLTEKLGWLPTTALSCGIERLIGWILTNLSLFK